MSEPVTREFLEKLLLSLQDLSARLVDMRERSLYGGDVDTVAWAIDTHAMLEACCKELAEKLDAT